MTIDDLITKIAEHNQMKAILADSQAPTQMMYQEIVGIVQQLRQKGNNITLITKANGDLEFKM